MENLWASNQKHEFSIVENFSVVDFFFFKFYFPLLISIPNNGQLLFLSS